jgi:hypothetical protein
MDDDLATLKMAAESAAQEVVQISQTSAAPVWDRTLVLTLSLSILVFGTIVILIMSYLVLQQSDTSFVLRAFGVPMIIVASIFLVVTGYSQQQIAPVIGLLGTIAGYLLGTNTRVQHSEFQRTGSRPTSSISPTIPPSVTP